MSNIATATAKSDTMTLYELSDRMGLPYHTLWEMARVNQLPVPVFRVGRRYLVSRHAYERLMNAQHEPESKSE